MTTYKAAGVSYETLDRFKRLAQKEAGKTGVSSGRGESAFIWEEKDCFRAIVIEGLGTKNIVADEMSVITGKTYYDAIAQDTVAMIVNDLIVVGAMPDVVNAYFAVGSSDWFTNVRRSSDLLKGWAHACMLSGAVWGGGETPALKDIIKNDRIDLAGSAVGIIKPKRRLMSGNSILPGDAIVLVESSGIHANGLTLARDIAAKLPDGYATKLEDGNSYGEAILEPTHIYVSLVRALFHNNLDLHYMVNITGHGWRKLMRAKKDVSYVIDSLPHVPNIFSFIQKHSDTSDKEMYGNFNMGAGFACIVSASDAGKAVTLAKHCGFNAWVSGHIEKGQKCVRLPNRVVFKANDLDLRY